jgi:hypothetical protein
MERYQAKAFAWRSWPAKQPNGRRLAETLRIFPRWRAAAADPDDSFGSRAIREPSPLPATSYRPTRCGAAGNSRTFARRRPVGLLLPGGLLR